MSGPTPQVSLGSGKKTSRGSGSSYSFFSFMSWYSVSIYITSHAVGKRLLCIHMFTFQALWSKHIVICEIMIIETIYILLSVATFFFILLAFLTSDMYFMSTFSSFGGICMHVFFFPHLLSFFSYFISARLISILCCGLEAQWCSWQ